MASLANVVQAQVKKDSKQLAVNQPVIAKNHPALNFCKKNKSHLFVYGLRGPRKNLCQAIQKQIGEQDPRHNYLVIDTLNDASILALKAKEQTMDFTLAIEDKTLARYAKAHFSNMREQSAKLENNGESKKHLLSYACRNALKTTKNYGISIFFQLEGLAFSEFTGRHKDGYTTGELRTLHQSMQNKTDLSHIRFVNYKVEIPQRAIKSMLDVAFNPKPSKALISFFKKVPVKPAKSDNAIKDDNLIPACRQDMFARSYAS